ncbi:MAG: HRDC domain-containing protein [Acidimicrobiales bacterium]|nr:HRDC domain-containing protein [Acidimicrobiales bacterium]MDP7123856.1 HRDC domain-containing protein [Acidimicrobiales bacterium]MDP7508362.1 HRDC domain-containing protein [Acidimicrobiales bacterium]HJM32692.1 HRDC domain-containing protein [Acidimicrobiales bacterium]
MEEQGAFEALVDELVDEPRIGVDTEFHRERTYYPQVALLQISWSDGLALVDPLAVDLRAFGSVLESDVLLVMHAAGQDLEVFDRACGTAPRNLFDTQLAAGFVGLSTPSLTTLCERELDIRLPKGDRLSDWLARPLTGSQLEYAAADVLHLLVLHDRLTDDLASRGRLAWAQDECQAMLDRSRGPREPSIAWERIKEVRRLRGAAFDRARAIAAWREREAAARDVPVRSVFSDLAVVAVAQDHPVDEEALRRIRGVDGRHLRNGAASSVLQAMAEAADLPPVPRDPARSRQGRGDHRAAVTLVSAWISQAARDLEIDPTLLGTRSDIEALVRGEEGTRLATGWRGDAVGEALTGLLAGHSALAFDGEGGLVLEDRNGS